ncbi:type 1 glutamine amidotransferase domain-containing protein [Pseudoxanthomonas sp. LjRoot143]|uniref:type 1 glutamine amidotransferase domain-containing protein n=1 Tax=Pseudoxanthomonas sp. LjRoot143 TaxID=3342266 RepID=UPI003ECC7F56
MKRWIKRGLLACAAGLVVAVVGGFAYVHALDLDSQPPARADSTVADLDFMRDAMPATRGKILAVVTSTSHFPGGEKKAGFELTELARAYYVFRANGYEVDIASPQGGSPPMRLDDEDMVAADYAFLNDTDARRKLDDSLRLAEVDPAHYAAVYFVGGKGTMFDFPDNADLQGIVRTVYQAGGVIGAVCHGPAALLEVVLDDGTPLLRNRRVAGFSNAEELFLIKDARARFPYLLQDRLQEKGAQYVEGPMYVDTTVVDGRLVTGQNPWSTWSTAEAMVRALGHEPVARAPGRDELAVQVLAAYHRDGIDAARRARTARPDADKRLLLMHALVAGMQGRLGEAWQLQTLALG